MRFDATGRRLITASRDRTARIWDASTGTLLHTLAGSTQKVTSATFNPDGSCVLTKNGEALAALRLWDQYGNVLLELPTDALPFQGHWSPDGRTIAAPLLDGTVQLWDTIPWPELDALGDDSLSFEDRVQLWRDQQEGHRADHP